MPILKPQTDASPYSIVKNESTGPRTAEITVFSPTQEGARCKEARDMVLAAAAHQLGGRVGMSNDGDVVPVDANGVASDDVFLGRVPVAGYHGIFKVSAMI
jgi:hypothetical protein